MAQYKVEEVPAVYKAIGRAFEFFERTDDAMYVLHRTLECEPTIAGFRTTEDHEKYWIKIPGKPYIKFPTVTALYTVSNYLVLILSIRIQHDGVIFHSAAFEGK